MPKVAATMTGASAFGSRWRKMIRPLLAPIVRARDDELPLPQREELRAHDAGDRRPAEQTDHHHDVVDARSQAARRA